MSARCQSCQQPIWWAITEQGRNIPLDEPTGVGNLIAWRDEKGQLRCRSGAEAGPGTHLTTSHFATCPDADQHRRPRRPREAGRA